MTWRCLEPRGPVWTTERTFLVQLDTGECVAWGDSNCGGELPAENKAKLEKGIKSVWSTEQAFLAQLHTGECLAWGDSDYGGELPDENKAKLEKGVKSVWSTRRAFLVQLHTGECLAWGDETFGGKLSDEHKAKLAKGTKSVWSNGYAFLAQLDTGECLAWGPARIGGRLPNKHKSQLEKGVKSVWSTEQAFLAQLHTGECLAWGDSNYGGELSDESKAKLEKGVKSVWSTRRAFLVQLHTGECLAWGDETFGGKLSDENKAKLAKGTKSVWSNGYAFLAQLDTGECLAWGNPKNGGELSDEHKAKLEKGIQSVWNTADAFLVQLNTGECLAWGVKAGFGEDVQQALLEKGIKSVWSTGHAFLAQLGTGECLVWGSDDGGADLSDEKKALLARGLRSGGSGASVASGSPRAAVKCLRDFDLSKLNDAQEAWAQDPVDRPSFETLREKLSQPSIPKQLPKEVPSYWSGQDLDQGWIAVPVAEETFQKLSALFVVTQPRELGTGRDAASYSRAYSNLKLWCAWRIEHQSLWDKYVAERNDVVRHLRQLERSSIETPRWRSKLEDATVGMPDELCAPIGERYLLHGTKPEVLLDILHQGFNDKLASLRGLFGAGAYFAEDPEKIDQYTREDPGHEAPGLERLHSRLYRAGGHQHPGNDIFYCFVVRVTCGACFLSRGFKDSLRDHDSDFQVFVNEDRRELSAVPGSDPRIPYHTLVVQTGKEAKRRIERFREVISFSANRAYPEYLLAYQRV